MNASDFAVVLGRASLEGAVFLVAAWMVARLWPGMPSGTRSVLWWLGSLRMLLGLVPLPAIPIGWPGRLHPAVDAIVVPISGVRGAVSGAFAPMAPAGPVGASWFDVLAMALTVVWLAGVAAAVAVVVGRSVALHRRWRRAAPFADSRIRAWADDWAVVLGSRQVPDVRVDDEAEVPMAVGVFRASVLLPSGSERLDDESLRLVLAHEMSHIRRGDVFWGWVPFIARLVFWFHPLVRLASREYHLAREESSDAAALRATGAPAHAYGSLLVRYAVATPPPPGVVACGTHHGRLLKRRLAMLSRDLTVKRAHGIAAAALLLVFALAGFVPIRLVAAGEAGSMRATSPDRYLTPFSYVITKRGTSATRGSVEERDFDAIRLVQQTYDEDLVWIRFGDRSWVLRGHEALASVREVLEPEDRFEERRRPREGRRQAIESKYREAMERYEALQSEVRSYEQRRELFETTWSERLEAGTGVDDLRARRDRLDRERAALEARESELSSLCTALSDQLSSIFAQEKKSYKEADQLRRTSMSQIQAIGRRAIAEGRAEEIKR